MGGCINGGSFVGEEGMEGEVCEGEVRWGKGRGRGRG